MSRVRVQAGNSGKPVSRREREHLKARLAEMPANRAEAFRALTDTASGRARLRASGWLSRLSPAEVRNAARTGAGVPVLPGGVSVDLEAVIAGLRRSERGRAALRARGLDP